MTPRTLAQAIPPKARTAIYSILATAVALELVWDVVPSALEGRVLGTFVVLGFGVSALNVST